MAARGLGGAVAVSFVGTWWLVGYGQNTGFLLLGLAGFLHFARRDRPFAAGACAALTALKPHLLAVFGVLLVAVGVAAAGPVAFVAFLSGPIARALNQGRTTLAGAGLVGALIVLVADHAGAYAFADLNLPVGVVTGAFGAPFLLWLLARGHTSRSTA